MRPLILVTNDDGIFAPGIKALTNAAKKHGDVVVVAPSSPQSGQSNAITLNEPLRIHQVQSLDGVEAYECSGTPVDCVKLARHVVLKGRKIDLCVSGINHGSNASINIIYSGTMAAAMEASIQGIPSIGFSHLDYSFDADFSAAQHYAEKIIEYALSEGMAEANLLNVNIPDVGLEEIKGIKICNQAAGKWNEDFVESKDPRGNSYYWMTGSFDIQTEDQTTDIWALKNNYISVVPSMHDLTQYNVIRSMSAMENAVNQ
jgi:5'-nucleotidase